MYMYVSHLQKAANQNHQDQSKPRNSTRMFRLRTNVANLILINFLWPMGKIFIFRVQNFHFRAQNSGWPSCLGVPLQRLVFEDVECKFFIFGMHNFHFSAQYFNFLSMQNLNFLSMEFWSLIVYHVLGQT